MKSRAVFQFLAVMIVLVAVLVLHGRATAPTAYMEAVAVIASTMPTSGDSDIDKIILDTGLKHGVDPKLVYYVIRQESNFKPRARSHKAAQGLMQIIPATAERFDVEDPYDPEQNIEGGVRYLRWLLKEFKGDVKLALAGYNAGEGNVKKCGNQVPEFKETQDYVKKIVKAYGKTHHPVVDPDQAPAVFGFVVPTAG
jgi:soluble lytic murein transglycosylase-like protein